MEMVTKVSGLIPAVFTPFDERGEVKYSTLKSQAKALRSAQIAGVFVNGTTGEGLSLTIAERKRVAAMWRDEMPDKLVMVNVGHQGIMDMKVLADHAQTIGVDAIAVVLPVYYKIFSVDEVVQMCAEVAKSAPELPFYYYHIPHFTGLNFKMSEFLRMAAQAIPNLAGVKFTHENLMDYSECLGFEDGYYNILFGRDEILLSALVMGAVGAIGSTYNFAAPLYNRIIEAFRAGDLETARREQQRAQQMIHIVQKYGSINAMKLVMGMVGLDCGPSRLPLREIPEDDQLSLRAELEGIGFFESIIH